MRNLQRPRFQTPDPGAQRVSAPSRRAWSGHARQQLISDGVVAGYIHDISTRHGAGVAEPRLRRRRGDQQ